MKKNKNLDKKNKNENKSIDNKKEENIKSPDIIKIESENREEFDPTYKLMERFTGKIDLNELNENISQAQLIFNKFGDKSSINKKGNKDAKKRDAYIEDLEYIHSLDDYNGEDSFDYQEEYFEEDYDKELEKLDDFESDKKTFIGKVKDFLGLSEDYYEDEDEYYDGLDYSSEIEKPEEVFYKEDIEINDDINYIDENLNKDIKENIINEENSNSINAEEDIDKLSSLEMEDDSLLDTQELNLNIEEDLLNERKRYSSENLNRRRIRENPEDIEKDLNNQIEEKSDEKDISEDEGILNSFVKNIKTAIQSTVEENEEEKQKKTEAKEKVKSEKKEKRENKKTSKKSDIEKDNTKDSKKKKPLLKTFSLIIGLVLVVFCGYIFLSGGNKYTLEEIYPAFAQALDEKDVDKLDKMLKVEGLGRKATSDEIESFLNLVDEDKSYKEDLLAKVNEDLEFFNKDLNYESSGFIKIKEDGKKNFLKDAYILELGETKAKSLDGDILLENGKETTISTEDTVNVVPGVYNGIKDNGVLKLSSKLKIDNRYLNDGEVDIKFNEADAEIANEKRNIEDGDLKIKINSSEKTAMVFINGENTELTVKDFNKLSSEDLQIGDKISLVSKLPWGYAISDEEEIKEEKESISLQVKKADNYMKEKFINIIKKTLKEDELGYETGDLSVFTTITGTQMDRNKSWINSNKSYNNYYIKDYRKVEIDMDSFDVGNNWQGPGYVGYMGGYLTYGQDKYNKNYGEKPNKENLTLYERERVGFHFKWMEDEKEWKIYMWGNTYRPISSNNLETIDLK